MQGSALSFASLGFLGGVASISIAPLGSPEALFCFLLAGAFILLSLIGLRSGSWRSYLLIASFLFAFGLGVIRFLDARELPDPAFTDAIGHFVRLEGVLLEEPVQRQNGTRVVLTLGTLYRGESVHLSERKVLVSAERTYSLRYGDRLRVEGKLVLPESFTTENGRVFDYPKYLEVRDISALVERPHLQVLGSGQGNPLRQKLFAFKNSFLEVLARVLPEPESTLLAGLLLGSQAALPSEVEDSFRTAGLSHIVVLSGYNITLVADASMKLLAFLPLLARLSVGGVMIVLFVLMVGGGAAAVRAAVMALLVLLARASGRTYVAGRALLLACTIMVVFDPRILLGDVSFQLSFLATAGLIYGSPIFDRLLARLPPLGGLRGLAVSTLSAQLFVLPLILYHSGLLSVVALPANLAVLPSVPVAMFLGAILGALALLSITLSLPIAYIVALVLQYQISAAKFFATLPWAYFLVPEFSPVLLVSVYLLGTLGLCLWYSRAAMPEETRSESQPQTN